MKTMIVVAALAAACISSSFADAAPRTHRAIPKRIAITRTTRERLVKLRIRRALGTDFADALFADTRFRIDPSLFRRVPANPAHPHHGAHDYDYVFSAWSIAHGDTFLAQHADAFALEERLFGIPRSVVNAFLDIETQWGRNTGRRPVVRTLYTLAVMRPNLVSRGWPEQQLIAFLRMCQKSGIDPFSIKGSSTGAFGLAQFEPTSYATFAVRCHDDNRPPDLFDNADAICSIGHYLRDEKWGATDRAQRHAVFSYNHDRRYIDAVLDYTDLFMFNIPPRRYRFVHPALAARAALK